MPRVSPRHFCFGKIMQKLSSRLHWQSTFRRLPLSASLMIILFLYLLVNCSLVFISQMSSSASAQQTEVAAQTAKPDATQQVETAKTAETAAAVTPPTPTPAPSPAPTPPPAPKPAPAYDKVSIPSIGLSSRYVPVGLTATNNIDVHATLVGMYTKRGQLGQPGTVFLDGHNPGVFSKLPRIGVGAVISVVQASGATYNYTVVHTETLLLDGIDMRKVLSPHGGASEALNLMTCVGTYNAAINTTDQRFVVYAVRS